MGDKEKAGAGASARGASKRVKARAHKAQEQDAESSADQEPTPASRKTKPKGQLGVPGSKDPSRRCTATANRTGKRCGAPAIKGGTVCRMHGGSLPQVKAKAKERLLALVDPALAALHEVLTNPKADDSTKVRAALGILDRTGHGPGAKLEIAAGPSAFDQVTAEALEVDRAMGTEQPRQIEQHSWEDVDTFQKDAQGKAWRELEREDDSALRPTEPFDGPVIRGEVVTTSILPDPAPAADWTEISGGVVERPKRRPDDPPAYWETD